MLDRHSEIIAHFIGQFDQQAEHSLLRLQYDAFRAQPRPDEAPGALREINVHVTSDLPADKNITGGVRWTDPRDAPHRGEATLELIVHDTGPVLPVPPAAFSETLADLGSGGSGAAHSASFTTITTTTTPQTPGTPQAPETPVLDIPAPGGVIVFAYQQNILQDNDLVLMRPLELPAEIGASRADAALDESLMTLAARADTLLPGDVTLAREHTDTAARTEALRETYTDIDPDAAPDGATVALFSASAGTLPDSGIVIDGTAADSLPSTLQEELDARGYGSVEEQKDDTGADGDATGDDSDATGSDGVVTATIVIGPDEAGPHADAMQLIETGGNLVMNTAASVLSAVDAPLIAVAGQATSLTIISQVNVLSDRDVLLRPDEAVHTTGAPVIEDDAPVLEDTASEGHNLASVSWEGASHGETDHSGGPVGFAITEIEGDLVLTTYTVQLNLITDNDVIGFQTTFHNVEIGTGGNLSVNLLEELGVEGSFDMILVGGDMQSLVSVSQVNVLLDDDLLVDDAGVGGDIQTAGNLLWNEAQVTWHGIDTAAEAVSQGAAAALETMAGGQLDLEALKGESLLDGKEVPLLLSVGGNLVLDYQLEQINILADADTVQLFADAAAQNGFNPVAVETGDNLLANMASLDIHGTDSTIMATDGVFSDLVIYQAGMYDTEEAPLDPDPCGSDLASEAVVFLADGMIDDGHGGDIGGGEVIVDTGGGSGAFDTLGGVVA